MNRNLLILLLIVLCVVLMVISFINSFKIMLYFGLVCGILLSVYYFYTKEQGKNYKENFVEFNFLHDAANIAANPEIYCGTDLILPEDYDVYGTRNRCLKKGVGIGMGMTDADVAAALARPPPAVPGPRLFCGNGAAIPAGYDALGTNYTCLRKGVGTGIRLPLAQRRAFQQRDVRPMGKKEIITLAKRLGITTHNRTRAATLQRIRDDIA